MAKYAVTVYETRSYTVIVEAPDNYTAKVNGVKAVETLGPYEPDETTIDIDNCWAEERKADAG